MGLGGVRGTQRNPKPENGVKAVWKIPHVHAISVRDSQQNQKAGTQKGQNSQQKQKTRY